MLSGNVFFFLAWRFLGSGVSVSTLERRFQRLSLCDEGGSHFPLIVCCLHLRSHIEPTTKSLLIWYWDHSIRSYVELTTNSSRSHIDLTTRSLLILIEITAISHRNKKLKMISENGLIRCSLLSSTEITTISPRTHNELTAKRTGTGPNPSDRRITTSHPRSHAHTHGANTKHDFAVRGSDKPETHPNLRYLGTCGIFVTTTRICFTYAWNLLENPMKMAWVVVRVVVAFLKEKRFLPFK